jgi:hypothetical protein
MKIGKPVGEVPANHPGRDGGKYAQIYQAVDKLSDGDWLPVTFDSSREAYNFRVAIETHRTRLLQGKQRGQVVYVRKKPRGK